MTAETVMKTKEIATKPITLEAVCFLLTSALDAKANKPPFVFQRRDEKNSIRCGKNLETNNIPPIETVKGATGAIINRTTT